MSTILDALKKSEQERKLNKLPTLVDITAPHEPSRWPVYLGLVLVVLAAALVVLAYVIWSVGPAAIQNADVGKSVVAVSPASLGSSVAEGSSRQKDPMLVNVVSYSDDPTLSFAMVNGKLLREGDFVEPGLKIAEIQFNSVVFNLRGKKITRSP